MQTEFTVGPLLDRRKIIVELPDEPSKLLVSLSGGADSAILLYLVCMLNGIQGGLHEIQTMTVPRDSHAVIFADGIIDELNDAFKYDLPPTLVIGDNSLPHSQVVNTRIKEIMSAGEYDKVYIGDNAIPPVPMPGLAPVRKSTVEKTDIAYLPFANVYKSHVLDLYFVLGLEPLLAITHSCTELPIGRCNACFQDAERAWALEQLLRKDPGIA